MSDFITVAELRIEAERLCDENERLEAENAKLRDGANAMRQLYEDELKHALAENAKLRDERDTYRDLVDYMVHPDIPDQLAADNAKLRELVSWMYDRMDESCAVQHPYAPAPISYDLLMQAWARARELGVEVDA